MKILVDLPDDYYEALLSSSHVYLTRGGRGNGKTLISTVLVAVANGTPLPKGHGRLIDAGKLESCTVYYAPRGFEGLLMRYADLQNAPTIIEADKEEKNNERHS